jgi:hypothetical protein
MNLTTHRAAWLLAAILTVATPLVDASPVTFTAVLDGVSDLPASGSPGTGLATVIFDIAAHTMDVDVSFSGLVGNTTASHIHCCTAVPNDGLVGVATTVPTFPGFPLGVTSGTYDHLFDMTLAASYNPAFVTAHGGTAATAEAALFAGLLDDKAYFNIHTSQFPGGEIRGFLVQQVPEPKSLALVGLALLALTWVRVRRAGTAVRHVRI